MSLDLSKPTDIPYIVDDISFTTEFAFHWENCINQINDAIKINILYGCVYVVPKFISGDYELNYTFMFCNMPHPEDVNYLKHMQRLYSKYGYTTSCNNHNIKIEWETNFNISRGLISQYVPVTIKN